MAILLVIVSLTWSAAAELEGAAARKELAGKLLDDGLTEDEQTAAIELLLAIESGYPVSKNGSSRTDPPGIGLLLIALVVAVVLSFPPKVAIGVGRGKRAVDRWRTWLRLVSYTVPVLVVWPLLQPHLAKYLGFVP
jgi:hypothetical protein